MEIESILTLFSVWAAVAAWLNARKLRREEKEKERVLNTPISIFLISDSETWECPIHPLRRQLSRAEIPGILGLYSGGQRFDLKRYPEIFENHVFSKVLTGESDVIKIKCSPEEIRIFKKI